MNVEGDFQRFGPPLSRVFGNQFDRLIECLFRQAHCTLWLVKIQIGIVSADLIDPLSRLDNRYEAEKLTTLSRDNVMTRTSDVLRRMSMNLNSDMVSKVMAAFSWLTHM